MGQYHILVNLDKQEIVHPHDIGLGLKQYEHNGAFNGSLSDAMYVLVMTSPESGGGDFPMTAISGRWVGDRVVILGDYTQDNSIPGISGESELYQIANKTYDNISGKVRDAFEKIYEVTYEQTDYGWGQRRKVVA
jgi:hypothetical protein